MGDDRKAFTEWSVGIPDEDSYLRRELYPSGVARGWRRTGCLLMLVAMLVFVVVFFVLVELVSG